MTITRRRVMNMIGTGAGAAFVQIVPPTVSFAQMRRRLSIGAAGAGGIFYPLGSGMAALISKYVPGTEATVEETDGSKDNMKLLHTGKVQLALVLADIAWNASSGQLEGVSETVAVRTLLATYSSHLHIVTLEGNGIETVSDLKGKRVCTGPKGGISEDLAFLVLEEYRIGPHNFRDHTHMDYAEAATALKQRELDVFFHNTGVPGKIIRDLAATEGLKIKLIPHGDAALKLAVRHPYYFSAPIPKGTYPGVDEDVYTVAAAVLLVAHAHLEDPLGYQITKQILERTPELWGSHPVAREITLQNAVRGSPIPFHSAAERYYREKGVTQHFLARCDARDTLSILLAPAPELPRCRQ